MAPKASRTWWRNQFYDHPGRALKHQDAYYIAPGGTTKVDKVYCKACFDVDVAELVTRDEEDLGLGRRNRARSLEEIKTYGMSSSLFLFIACGATILKVIHT